MTLRSRLVLALVALSTVGLAVFGFATYSLYERSQLSLLDDQLRDNALPIASRLQQVRAYVGDGTTCGSDATTSVDPETPTTTRRVTPTGPTRGPSPARASTPTPSCATPPEPRSCASTRSPPTPARPSRPTWRWSPAPRACSPPARWPGAASGGCS
ncbi:MAG: hypothetical protein R2746_17235 [Acidimicrobiales bacterium]